MAKCIKCNKRLFLGGSVCTYGAPMCKNCELKFHNSRRQLLLDSASRGELFRIPRVELSFAYDVKENHVYENCEGDLIFMEDAVGFVGYWFSRKKRLGEDFEAEFSAATEVLFIGLAGSIIKHAIESPKSNTTKSNTTKSDANNPAVAEVLSKIDKIQNGQSADLMSTKLEEAIRHFPYVSYTKREFIKNVKYKKRTLVENNVIFFLKFKKGDVAFRIHALTELDKLVTQNDKTLQKQIHRNPLETWKHYEERIVAYIG